MKSSIPNISQIFQPKLLDGSFSAVSTPIFASKYSFCSVFRDLQDSHILHRSQLRKVAKFHQKFTKFCWNFRNFVRFCWILWNSVKISAKFDGILLRFRVLSGAKVWKSCRFRKTLQNDALDAKIGVDTAENEPSKVWWFGWEIWEKIGIEPFN